MQASLSKSQKKKKQKWATDCRVWECNQREQNRSQKGGCCAGHTALARGWLPPVDCWYLAVIYIYIRWSPVPVKTGSCVMGILPPCRGAPMRFRFLQYWENCPFNHIAILKLNPKQTPISHHIVVLILCPKPLCETFWEKLDGVFLSSPWTGPHTKRGGEQHTHGKRSWFFVQQNSPWQGGSWCLKWATNPKMSRFQNPVMDTFWNFIGVIPTTPTILKIKKPVIEEFVP